MVLCHGGPGSPDYLGPAASLLSDALRVHRWQQRGSGRSDRHEPYNLARYVQDLENVRAHFGHVRWLVAGHSWGASLGLLYALDHEDRTEALIYVSGTGLNWARWKAQYHEEARSRFTDDQRRRYLDLKTSVDLSDCEVHINIDRAVVAERNDLGLGFLFTHLGSSCRRRR